ncbi:MAG: efflux RND transporter periplasmic adaptor subunit, partial [Verrucomicrobiae bacterium]|nr:efflux RND transporter periplasmic adaptor subunit [Verrucomicrobiae bacterium]
MHHPTSEAAGRSASASAEWPTHNNAPTPSPSPSPAPAPVRLGRTLLIVAVLLAAVFVAGLIPRRHERRAVAAITRELAVPVVSVVSAARGQAAAPVSLPAEIRPRMEASIYARATGYVKQWHVDLGANVTEGQVLAELDTPELSQELSRAEAAVRETEAALDLATKTAARSEQMRQGRVISDQEADERSAEKTLRAAQLESARAEVRRLQSLLGFARLTAPFTGTITARRLEVGQLVSAASGTELYRLAQTDSLRVFVRVPQT